MYIYYRMLISIHYSGKFLKFCCCCIYYKLRFKITIIFNRVTCTHWSTVIIDYTGNTLQVVQNVRPVDHM